MHVTAIMVGMGFGVYGLGSSGYRHEGYNTDDKDINPRYSVDTDLLACILIGIVKYHCNMLTLA